jgi:hypothetical protein
VTDIADLTDPGELLKLGRDVWAVACNYREATKIARDGAKAFVSHGGAGSGYSDLEVVVRSRGCRKLTNFRATCVPVGHPMRARADVRLDKKRGYT